MDSSVCVFREGGDTVMAISAANAWSDGQMMTLRDALLIDCDWLHIYLSIPFDVLDSTTISPRVRNLVVILKTSKNFTVVCPDST